MIFRWLHVRRTKSLFKGYVSEAQLQEIAADAAKLSEWQAFLSLIPLSLRRPFWTEEDHRKHDETIQAIQRTIAEALRKQNGHADRTGL